MRWVWHGKYMAWQTRGTQRVLVGNQQERNNRENLGIDGRMILKWILEK